jgi:hypothetical protein
LEIAKTDGAELSENSSLSLLRVKFHDGTSVEFALPVRDSKRLEDVLVDPSLWFVFSSSLGDSFKVQQDAG